MSVVLTAAFCLAAAVFDVLDRSTQALWPSAPALLVPLLYTMIGALIARRQPDNAIGW
ncbi:MAG: hypothetical protein QOI72_1474, partial [Solirubrobacterales bacterium]|nr:hypothetical protein [Solirubrobacterales bacterium]